MNQFKVLIDNNITGKIQMIKAMRSIIGLGLKEAKDFVEDRLQVPCGGSVTGTAIKKYFTLILTAEQLGNAYFLQNEQTGADGRFFIDNVERWVTPPESDIIDCTDLLHNL